jgi:hypothetical protein
MPPLIEKRLTGPGLVQFKVLDFVDYRRQRSIHIFEPLRIVLDFARKPFETDYERCPSHGLHGGLRKIARIEQPGRFERQMRPTLMPTLQPQRTAFERMDPLDRMVTLKTPRS